MQTARQGQQVRTARTNEARQDNIKRSARIAEGRKQQTLTRVSNARGQYKQATNNRRRQAALDAKTNGLGNGTLSAGDDLNGIQSEVRPGLDGEGNGTGGSGSIPNTSGEHL